MMPGIKLSTGILIICFFGGCFGDGTKPPTPTPKPIFSDHYEAKGILTVPKAEIREPFHAWFDLNSNNSRIDFYDGAVKTYQRPHCSEFGTLIEIVSDKQGEDRCWRLTGTETHKISIQSVIPDFEDFVNIGADLIDGAIAEAWERSVTHNSVTTVYTFWTRSNKKTGEFAVPVRYEVKATHDPSGSIYDYYFLNFDWISNEEVDPTVFDVPKDLEGKCKEIIKDFVEKYAFLNPMREYVNGEDQHISDAFEIFKIRYDRHYATATEEALRRKTFTDNYRYIMSTNRASRRFTAGINHFADRTDEEMRGYTDQPEEFVQVIENKAIPTNFSWTRKGADIGMKDQGNCAGCWAFAAAAAVEGALHVQCDHMASMSEQALLDCTGSYGNKGCVGGTVTRAFKWMMKEGGLPPANIYGHYSGQVDKCHVDEIDLKDKIRVSNYQKVNSDIESIKIALMNKGPLAVSFDSTRKSFLHYRGGIYDECGCDEQDSKKCLTTLNHAGVLIGFGVDDTKVPYWILKNSWGDWWGDKGYIYIPQEISKDCGISVEPYYVELENCLRED